MIEPAGRWISLPSVAAIAPPAPITAPRSSTLQAAEKASDDRADTSAGARGASPLHECRRSRTLEWRDRESDSVRPRTSIWSNESVRLPCLSIRPGPLHVGNDTTNDGPRGNEHTAVLHDIDNSRRFEPLLDRRRFGAQRRLQSHVQFLADGNDSGFARYSPARARMALSSPAARLSWSRSQRRHRAVERNYSGCYFHSEHLPREVC